jgi:hypothetical protein
MFSGAHQAYRQHPWLRQKGNIAVMLPGFGTAVAIYGTYLFCEAVYVLKFAPDPRNAPYKPRTFKSAYEAGVHTATMTETTE